MPCIESVRSANSCFIQAGCIENINVYRTGRSRPGIVERKLMKPSFITVLNNSYGVDTGVIAVFLVLSVHVFCHVTKCQACVEFFVSYCIITGYLTG